MFLYDPKETETKPEVKLEPWQQNLLNAAQYIREFGWCQGAIGDGLGRVCLVGSLYASVGVLPQALAKVPFLQRSIKEEWDQVIRQLGGHGIDVASWNDAPSRTKEEVIAVLEGAARQ